jgi:Asp-tRNA(Asn)/Glu-tRNA(Gln) amidotransferase A subunit family amidase
VLAPTVADAALGLRITSDGAVAGAASVPGGLTIAVSVDDGVFPVAPAVRRAVHEAAEVLANAGCTIVDHTLPGEEALALLSPTAALPAIRHGASDDLGLMGSYTAVYNTLGWPAGTVPFTCVRPGEESDRRPGRDRVLEKAAASEAGSAGLPIGVQLSAPHGADDLVLGLMQMVESAAPDPAPHRSTT